MVVESLSAFFGTLVNNPKLEAHELTELGPLLDATHLVEFEQGLVFLDE